LAALSHDATASPIDASSRAQVPESLPSKCNDRPPASWFMTAGRSASTPKLAHSISSKVDTSTLHARRMARPSKLTNRDGLAHVGFAPRDASWALPALQRLLLERSKCVFGLRKKAHAYEPGCRLPTKGSTRSYRIASPLRLYAVPVVRKPWDADPLLTRFLIQDADLCLQI
jgi:hypothetical protein